MYSNLFIANLESHSILSFYYNSSSSILSLARLNTLPSFLDNTLPPSNPEPQAKRFFFPSCLVHFGGVLLLFVIVVGILHSQLLREDLLDDIQDPVDSFRGGDGVLPPSV